jgi:hypothetical protein
MNIDLIKRINMLLKEDISTWTRAIRFYKKKKKHKVKCEVESDSKGYFIMTYFDANVVEIGLKKDNKYPVFLTGKMAEKTYFSDKSEAESFARELENGINSVDAVGINDVFKRLQKKYKLK